MLRKLILNLFEAAGGISPGAGDNSTVEGGSTEGSTVESSNDTTNDSITLTQTELNERIAKAVKGRIKANKDAEAKLSKLNNAFGLLSSKYGIDADDFDGLAKAIETDESFYEQSAMERGVSNEMEMYIQGLEREKALNQERERLAQEESARLAKEAENNAIIEKWMGEADKVKQTYPEFDFKKCMQESELFRQLMLAVKADGFTMQRAYETAFPEARDRAVASKVAENIRAKGQRPVENGAVKTPGATAKPDIKNMSVERMNELIAQARRGKIVKPY